jgi:hypothetical protein
VADEVRSFAEFHRPDHPSMSVAARGPGGEGFHAARRAAGFPSEGVEPGGEFGRDVARIPRIAAPILSAGEPVAPIT